jgi:Cu/Zn superoxide dismutase
VLIHEEGSCEPPDFESAGDGTEYGKLEVGEDGDALHTSTTGRLSLTEGEDALLDEDGAAIVLHRHGDRVACGELLLLGLPDAGGGGLAKSRSVPPGGDALLLGALAVLAGLSVRRRFVRP